MNNLKIDNGLIARDIALELDYNRWTIGALIRSDRVLQIDSYIKSKNENGKNHYYITEKAINIFFDGIR